MQQFATSQTSIAANKLAFDDIKQSSATPHDASNSAFNTSIDSSRQDSNSQKSAFEDALSKQEQSAQSKVRHNSDLAESKSKEAVQQDIEQVNKSRSDEKSLESKESKLIDNKDASEQQVKPEKQRHSDVSNSDNIVEDFDWVTYVNKVKDLSAPAETIPNDLHIEGDEVTLDFITKTMTSLNSENQAELEVKATDSSIITASTDTEFLEIKLSEDELAALINAAGGNSEKGVALNSQEMTELDNAIAKLLNQLVSKDGGKSSKDTELESNDQILKDDISHDTASNDMEKDADLLKDLLQVSPIDILDKQKVPMPLEVTPIDTELKTDTELVDHVLDDAVALKEQDGSDVIKESEDDSEISHVKIDEYRVPKPIETADEKISLLRDSDIETSNVVSAQTVKQGVESSLNQVGKGQEGALFVAVDNTSAKKQGELLAKLPPEAESSVIETIATRVESVISDIKAEGKSTEFIAALQSGVKEMKEQLKQGREPGIDLKTLVTDALAESNVKVSGSAEPALDKQLSQMSTTLATANSLNQTSQQQNYLNTGLNEVQGIKEISQQQIESTRLAQQNVVVNEKAVNIFKPEGQQQLADKVRWMANSRNLTAEIRLDPPDLGGMNIKVSLSGDSASVSFVVQSQHARDALDQAVPRLREMLAEQGIELGQSSVEQDSSGQNQQSQQGNLANNSSTMGNLAQQSQDENENSLNSSGEFIEQRISGGRIGGIDYYA